MSDVVGRLTGPAVGLRWGDTAVFETSVTGNPGPHDEIYVTVIALQNGKVVYQWSQHVNGSPLSFPLEDQAGDGLNADVAYMAKGSASLLQRIPKGKGFTIRTLDTVTFWIATAR